MQLRQTTLMNQSAAGTLGPFPLDYRFPTTPTRVIQTAMNGADTILIEGTIDGTNWVTIASHTAGTSFVDTLSIPYYQIRVTKTGTAGNARVTGII
jgi:hypothetical protein